MSGVKQEEWRKYQAYFDGLSDADIELECRNSESLIADETDWLEAVAAWKAAGKPRTPTQEPTNE